MKFNYYYLYDKKSIIMTMSSMRKSSRVPKASVRYSENDYNLSRTFSEKTKPKVSKRTSIQTRAAKLEALFKHSYYIRKLKEEIMDLEIKLEKCEKKNKINDDFKYKRTKLKVKGRPSDVNVLWMGESILNANGYYKNNVPEWVIENPLKYKKKNSVNSSKLNETILKYANKGSNCVRRRNMTVARIKRNKFKNVHRQFT